MTDVYLSSDNSFLSQDRHSSLFDRLAVFQLSTASVPSKLIHLGTDPMLVLNPRPILQSDVGMCTAMHGEYAER